MIQEFVLVNFEFSYMFPLYAQLNVIKMEVKLLVLLHVNTARQI